jgi:hypothetical protein
MTQINKGKSVRATALVVGTAYVMTTWTKPEKTDTLVTFRGFGSTFKPESIPQLKTLTEASKFYFQIGEDLVSADGRVAGNVFYGEGAGHRVTFFEVAADGEAAPIEVAAAATTEAPVEGSQETIEAPVEEVVEA